MNHPYVTALTSLFTAHAHPENADAMAKYMRNQFIFLGIRAPEAQEMMRQFIKTHELPVDDAEIKTIIRTLWDLPEREYQYAVLSVISSAMRKKMPLEHIDLLEYLIAAKSWWDTVDPLATEVGAYFMKFPQQISPYTQKWMNSGNMWLKRVAIIFQLKYKSQTDTKLLFSFIEKSVDDKSFFIRKAIGWALREYSKTDEQAVRNYVQQQPMSPLSAREALKWLNSRKK